MRPPSIVMFERLFLASLALSVIGFVVSYDAAMEQLAAEPVMESLGLGAGLVIGTMVFVTAIYLLLWFLIAHKASVVAKWILVVFTAIGVASFVTTLAIATIPWDPAALLGVVMYALEIAAVVFLFRDDAKAWFSREWNVDAVTFN